MQLPASMETAPIKGANRSVRARGGRRTAGMMCFFCDAAHLALPGRHDPVLLPRKRSYRVGRRANAPRHSSRFGVPRQMSPATAALARYRRSASFSGSPAASPCPGVTRPEVPTCSPVFRITSGLATDLDGAGGVLEGGQPTASF